MYKTVEEFDEDMERELADHAPWKKIQQNTFTKWINKHLRLVNTQVEDLQTDLADGLKLIALTEVLSCKKLPKHTPVDAKFHADHEDQPHFEKERDLSAKKVFVRCCRIYFEGIGLYIQAEFIRNIPKLSNNWHVNMPFHRARQALSGTAFITKNAQNTRF
ncbi:unnamed protein product [Didymodactylos carnosus]|uniref:Calponin-homology (CH) domain-containing protein n=1 Tax=Didymodactylos carnosus TaxID=1234261 RepID=A0A8S2FVW0_9BILA|nr:unnamed protein product [Didymodactylos carnosus]CAF4354955.1 unnamed protein product [Didymodactylos carnosus]